MTDAAFGCQAGGDDLGGEAAFATVAQAQFKQQLNLDLRLVPILY
jgi:hypothetical protein